MDSTSEVTWSELQNTFDNKTINLFLTMDSSKELLAQTTRILRTKGQIKDEDIMVGHLTVVDKATAQRF